MTLEHIESVINLLKKKKVTFEKGLKDEEFLAIEEKFGFTFPTDLRFFLSNEMPNGSRFPNWRKAILRKKEYAEMLEWLNMPLDGVLFDIEYNNFWYEKWGEKPNVLAEQIEVATKIYATYPKLIPIYAHRFMPSFPTDENNPVYSVHQTDVIYYGYNLVDYFANEFEFKIPDNIPKINTFKPINDFWTWVINK